MIFPEHVHTNNAFFQKQVIAFLHFFLQMLRFEGEANFSFATIFDATISVASPFEKELQCVK